ncbi:helix-turn-helix domain-containing protein [Corynebacterium bovis]|uniref:Transcriptional regulator n=1 Tax=Corynebacterium bovis TaxID=36808 RepID=A0A3R8R573_9CORY|nr:XRE family transcriptional regulator [Corynebacterium bovis]RRO92776.1 transcriptional regulator [Corynebacterium bovis]RRO98703.1 transcriptional regulator [Corynebacterium bovis]RRQ00487.1 transcriptional regulator [Corynebacterium bovis]RRQ00691.1 transcriptional regulator [Corynebacterium bovis]RRQ03677.1 transcriptional regulator [Corynebacterium bovis]
MTSRTTDVWAAISDSPSQAENLRLRSALMGRITQEITDNGWSQHTAGEHLGITQPRVSALVNGHIDKFSLDALVTIGAHVGIYLRLAEDPDPVAT